MPKYIKKISEEQIKAKRLQVILDPVTGEPARDIRGRIKYKPNPQGKCACGSLEGKLRWGCQYSCDPCHAKYVAADKRKRQNNIVGRKPIKKIGWTPMDASDTVMGRDPIPYSRPSYPMNFSCNYQPSK